MSLGRQVHWRTAFPYGEVEVVEVGENQLVEEGGYHLGPEYPEPLLGLQRGSRELAYLLLQLLPQVFYPHFLPPSFLPTVFRIVPQFLSQSFAPIFVGIVWKLYKYFRVLSTGLFEAHD